MLKNNPFVFTEAYNCGKIVNIALESFFKYHNNYIVNVFGTSKDFSQITLKHKNINFINLEEDKLLEQYYQQGHKGTSYIFTKVILKSYGDYDKIIHFDSDVLFRDECISDVISGLYEGYDLIGQRRAYEKNRCGRMDLIGIPDVISTCFFGINLDKLNLNQYNFETIRKMVQGVFALTGEPILDFFDPISFHMLRNGSKIKFLNYIDYGGSNEEGNWDNGYNGLNILCDYGKKFVHFAGVGSGLNFYEKGGGNVPPSYVNWAKGRYGIFSKLFFNEEINYPYPKEEYIRLKEGLNL